LNAIAAKKIRAVSSAAPQAALAKFDSIPHDPPPVRNTEDPARHDRAMAFLSHLPQLLSTGLASLISERAGADFIPTEFAASGFRNATRLAESPYSVWRDICLTNTENIQEALDLLIAKLETVKRNLRGQELEREFESARELRRHLREIE